MQTIKTQVNFNDKDYIKLCDLLQLAGVCQSGGEAKQLIKEGCVKLGNEVCTEKGKKITQGQKVLFKDELIIEPQREANQNRPTMMTQGNKTGGSLNNLFSNTK
ncbi:MAG: RNA-binding S4 domain-containing protein [Oscillospiraceae bacterium]|jgi:ribosome-associated protein|nr:RNA-binding S4 domain-containing protein [Oscillospiraceae bacterium]